MRRDGPEGSYGFEKTQLLPVRVLPTHAVQTKVTPDAAQLLQPGPTACAQEGQEVPLMTLPLGQARQSLLLLPLQVEH